MITLADIPGPDMSKAPEESVPFMLHPCPWPGWVEVVYTCKHIYAMRKTDELPQNCPDPGHTPPPDNSPFQVA